VRLRWGDEDTSLQWPFDDPSAIGFAVLMGGAVRGMVQYGEEDEPDYRHASIDIFLDPYGARARCWSRSRGNGGLAPGSRQGPPPGD